MRYLHLSLRSIRISLLTFASSKKNNFQRYLSPLYVGHMIMRTILFDTPSFHFKKTLGVWFKLIELESRGQGLKEQPRYSLEVLVTCFYLA